MRELDRVRVTDDRGNVYRVAGGSGGGSGARWSFSTHLVPPVPEDTAALRFEGEGGGTPVRVPLTEPPAGVRVGPVEDLPEDERWSPAERFLVETAQRSFQWWRRVEAHGGRPAPPPDDIAIDALVATGALGPDSPAITMHQALARTRRGEPPPPELPSRWASTLAHLDAEDGPVATALIGVALPRLGEREVWLDAITSDSDSWEVHTFVRPGSGGAGPGQFGMNEPSLTAVDDLGGFYTSSIGRGGGGSDGLSIALRFVPRLNPRARELTLFSTGSNRRVRVIVPLPKPWGGPT